MALARAYRAGSPARRPHYPPSRVHPVRAAWLQHPHLRRVIVAADADRLAVPPVRPELLLTRGADGGDCTLASECGLWLLLGEAHESFYRHLDAHTLAECLPRPRVVPMPERPALACAKAPGLDSQHQYMCCPPLIDSVLPVMKSAPSAVRNATPRAISSAWPSRPTGMRATIFCSTSAGTARTMSVST